MEELNSAKDIAMKRKKKLSTILQHGEVSF
jgi:hypothetical protein